MQVKTYNPASDPAVRRTMIGGSDAAKVAGESSWGTALDLYLFLTGATEDDVRSAAAEWGTILEPVLLRQFAMRSGMTVVGRDRDGELVRFHPDGWVQDLNDHEFEYELMGTLRHAEREWMGCHLDGIAKDETGGYWLVEAKTAGHYRGVEFGDDETDELPTEYVVQAQHNMEVVRSNTGYIWPTVFPALIAGQKWRTYRVDYNESLVTALLAMEDEFWNVNVQQRIPPPAEPDERGKKALSRLYPEDSGSERLVLPGDPEVDLVHELARARVEHKRAEALKVEAENRVKEAMGPTARLEGQDWSLTWKNQKPREVVDWKAAYLELSNWLGLRLATGRRKPRIETVERALADIQARHTTERPGPRVFNCRGLGKIEAALTD